MTIHEFNSCSVEKRSEFIWEWGYYLANFKTATRNTVYFSLGSFLAEVHYALPANRIEFIKGLRSEELPAELLQSRSSDPFVLAAQSLNEKDYQSTGDPQQNAG